MKKGRKKRDDSVELQQDVIRFDEESNEDDDGPKEVVETIVDDRLMEEWLNKAEGAFMGRLKELDAIDASKKKHRVLVSGITEKDALFWCDVRPRREDALDQCISLFDQRGERASFDNVGVLEEEKVKMALKNTVERKGMLREDHVTTVPMKEEEEKKKKPDTAGDDWYGMSAPHVTPELKRDLLLLKMRGHLDPKRFFKKNDSKELPKYFHVGTVLPAANEAAVVAGQRRRKKSSLGIVDDLIKDAKWKSYAKRKFTEIQKVKQSGHKSKRSMQHKGRYRK